MTVDTKSGKVQTFKLRTGEEIIALTYGQYNIAEYYKLIGETFTSRSKKEGYIVEYPVVYDGESFYPWIYSANTSMKTYFIEVPDIMFSLPEKAVDETLVENYKQIVLELSLELLEVLNESED